jgi:deoxyadenosine/deoxycytidine kinase
MDILKDKYISFAGLIGSGKSTLSKYLSNLIGVKLYKENVENPILKLFYSNMTKYSFLLEMDLLRTRSNEQKDIIKKGEGAIQDRSIYEDLCFVEMLHKGKLISDDEYKVYIQWYAYILANLPSPDLIIWLVVTPETALRRIEKRKKGSKVRKMESSISIDYLKNLDLEYKDLIKHIRKKIPIIEIEWNSDSSNLELEAKKIVSKIIDTFNEGFYKKIIFK